jgi:hypothetical protein
MSSRYMNEIYVWSCWLLKRASVKILHVQCNQVVIDTDALME